MADETTLALTLVAKELGIGAVVGLVVAGSGAWLLDFCHKRDWISEVWMQLSVPALAIASFAIAQSLRQIPRVAVMGQPWTIDAGLMTPTLKLKRAKILEAHGADVDRLYAKR